MIPVNKRDIAIILKVYIKCQLAKLINAWHYNKTTLQNRINVINVVSERDETRAYQAKLIGIGGLTHANAHALNC